MSKRVKIPSSITRGFGWSSIWSDGSLGWFCSEHFSQTNCKRRYAGELPEKYSKAFPAGRDRFFLVEVTMKPVLSKSGRPITKIARANP